MPGTLSHLCAVAVRAALTLAPVHGFAASEEILCGVHGYWVVFEVTP